MTELEAVKLQKIVYASYPWVEVDPLRTRVFFRVLEHYTFDECSSAAIELLREPDRTHPPTTNDIMRILLERKRAERQAAQSDDDDTPLERRQEIVNRMHELFPDLFK